MSHSDTVDRFLRYHGMPRPGALLGYSAFVAAGIEWDHPERYVVVKAGPSLASQSSSEGREYANSRIFACRLLGHRWTDWYWVGPGRFTGYLEERRCLRCGRHESVQVPQ